MVSAQNSEHQNSEYQNREAKRAKDKNSEGPFERIPKPRKSTKTAKKYKNSEYNMSENRNDALHCIVPINNKA